ncbi:FG-GAP repeat domain-containing protein [Paenibacillus solisilvae]|uniref:FG-GAP repeat domain-containing protein n=1 Tax=Paenibacillus solisilvae TaxID=2486751 RepID=A0ABW0VZS8_9BACL
MMRLHWARQLGIMSLCILGLLGMTGCQYTATPADLLLNPQSTPENAVLASAVRDALPSRAKLSLPVQEKSNSAVMKADINGDGELEALVTFINNNSAQQVMVLQSNKKGGWKYWFTFEESSNYGIDVLRIADLDHDGKPEVLIGWNQYGEPEHLLNIYHVPPAYKGDVPLKPLKELSYDTMSQGDVDGDGKSELVLIRLNSEKMTASIHVFRFLGGAVLAAASTSMDGSVNGYYNISIGKIAPKRFGIITDAIVGAHSSNTTMLLWDKGKLLKIYPSSQRGAQDEDSTMDALIAGDGNGDGILDIHVLREAPGQDEGVPYSDLVWIEQYKQWDGAGRFDVVGERYADYEQNFALRIPAGWQDYTVRHPKEGSKSDIAVDYYDSKSGKRIEVMVIRIVPLNDWDAIEHQLQENASEFMLLERAAGMVYYAVWDKLDDTQQVNPLPPSETTLKNMFMLLPEQ